MPHHVASIDKATYRPTPQDEVDDPPGAIFGAELDSLPDFWDEGLTFDVQQQRIGEVLHRQQEFARALAFLGGHHRDDADAHQFARDLASRDDVATFELRLISAPGSTPRLRIVYLVSVEDDSTLEVVWRLFHSTFPGDLDFRLKVLPAEETERLCRQADHATLDYYEWRPEPTTITLGAEEHRFVVPPSPRVDGRLALIRALLQYHQPVTVGFAVTPLSRNDYYVERTREAWQRLLRLAEPTLFLAQAPGGPDELAERLGGPAFDHLLDMLLTEDTFDHARLKDLVLDIAKHQRRERYAMERTYRLKALMNAAERMVQSNAFFRWRVHAATLANSSLGEMVINAVADDLGRNDQNRLVTSYRLYRCEKHCDNLPADNFRSVRTKWTQSPDYDEMKEYIPLGELVDDVGAAALLHLPILPQGGIPGMRSHQANPFAAWQLSQDAVGSGIDIGNYIDSRISMFHEAGHGVTLDLNDLTRHALITGSTGSGKSTTSKRLLTEIHRRQIPFLVIEPVKAEYGDLAFTPEFLEIAPQNYPVFLSPGSVDAPLWFNPCYVPKGVSVNTHISYLLSCFMAAFPMPGIFGLVLARVLHKAYQIKGGELVSQKRFDRSPFEGNVPLTVNLADEDVPDFALLHKTAQDVIEELDYRGDFAGNLKTAITLRLESLQQGVIGAALKKPHRGGNSFEKQVGEILKKPVVIQLNHIADKSEKALVMAFLLTALYEYYEQQPTSEHLRHVTLIEEAHVLLEHVPRGQSEESANSRGKAIELFADMLAEIRSRGEGLVIVEQLPSKLIPEAIKNTNLKIMHRLTAREDREILGAAMNFNDRQSRFATTLQRGQAIIFREGLSQPALIQVRDISSRGEVRTHVDAILAKLPRGKEGTRYFLQGLQARLDGVSPNDPSTVEALASFVGNYLHSRNPIIKADDREAICWYLHQITRPFPKEYLSKIQQVTPLLLNLPIHKVVS